MITVVQVARWLESFAPSRLSESWDNVGLLLGDPDAPVTRVMTCLTVTRRTAAEAVEEGAELIVSHHPILFRAAKRIRPDLAETAPVWLLARSGIAVASPHTAFDSTSGGINDGLACRLGLVEVTPLRRLTPPGACKIVVFTPESDREAVLAAGFAAGAGHIGDYRECSFAIPGQGTFFGSEETNPTVGQRGRREMVEELRLELVCPRARLASVMDAIREAHSYEEPAIDVYPLEPEPGRQGEGSGRIGRLAEPLSLQDFARFVAGSLGHAPGPGGRPPDRPVSASPSPAARRRLPGRRRAAGADVLVTGEARFHRALEAEALDIGLILAGHHGTERPGVEDLAELIARAFPNLTVWPSRRERDPIRLVTVGEPREPEETRGEG
ncbi:MAG: Nif3-like dinuclear metal center hexameric protein [Isosphaeraceae bacterium]